VGRASNLVLVGLPLGAFLGLTAWRVLVCDCRTGPDPAALPGPPAAKAALPLAAAGGGEEAGLQPWPRLDLPPEPEVVVSWQEAGQWVDHVVGVEGVVVQTHDSGRATFLNFAEDWRGRFRGVVFASCYREFPEPPATWLRNRKLRLLGRVKRYRGAPEIVIESPVQVVFLDEDGPAGR